MSSALIHYPGKLKNLRTPLSPEEKDNKLELHTYLVHLFSGVYSNGATVAEVRVAHRFGGASEDEQFQSESWAELFG